MLRKLICASFWPSRCSVEQHAPWPAIRSARYSVVGSNPGGRAATPEPSRVERTGDTFRVTWDIGSQTYVGTGIGSEKGIAVSYRSGNQTGLAIYGANGDNWEGVWTYTGGREVGGEAWTRR